MKQTLSGTLMTLVFACALGVSSAHAELDCVWNPGTMSWSNAGVMDRRSEKPPEFGVDHKGMDRAFGTQIMRLTGPKGSNALIEADGLTRNNNPWMHFANPWSRSGDHFIFESFGRLEGEPNDRYITRIMALDRASFTVTERCVIPKTPNGEALVSQNKSLWFSPDEELLLFGVTSYQAQLWAYNADAKPVTLGTRTLAPGEFLLLADFASLVPGTPIACDQGFMWQDGKMFSYGIKERAGKPLGVATWSWTDDPQKGKTVFISTKDYRTFDEPWCDRKDYVWMAGSNDGNPAHFPDPAATGIVRYDRAGAFVDVIRGKGPEVAFAGTGKACGFDGWWANRNHWEHNRMFLRKAADVKTFWQIWPPTAQAGAGIKDDALKIGDAWAGNPSFHVRGWVYWAEYSTGSKADADFTKTPTTFVGQDEIVAVDVSNPGGVSRFRRICRLWNDDVDRSWKYQPDCAASPGNDYVLYWSNMAAAGEDYRRTDSFLARVVNAKPAPGR